MSQLRGAKRILKGTKVLGKGTAPSQVQAHGQLTNLRRSLISENKNLIETGNKGTWSRISTNRKARKTRKLISKTEGQIKGLEKAKPIKSHLAGKEQARVDRAAAKKKQVKAEEGGGIHPMFGLATAGGGGYLAGNVGASA